MFSACLSNCGCMTAIRKCDHSRRRTTGLNIMSNMYDFKYLIYVLIIVLYYRWSVLSTTWRVEFCWRKEEESWLMDLVVGYWSSRELGLIFCIYFSMSDVWSYRFCNSLNLLLVHWRNEVSGVDETFFRWWWIGGQCSALLLGSDNASECIEAYTIIGLSSISLSLSI